MMTENTNLVNAMQNTSPETIADPSIDASESEMKDGTGTVLAPAPRTAGDVIRDNASIIAAGVGGTIFTGAVAALLIHRHNMKKRGEEPKKLFDFFKKDDEIEEPDARIEHASDTAGQAVYIPEPEEEEMEKPATLTVHPLGGNLPGTENGPTDEEIAEWVKSTRAIVADGKFEDTVKSLKKDNGLFEGVMLFGVSGKDFTPLSFEQAKLRAASIAEVHSMWAAGFKDASLEETWTLSKSGKYKFASIRKVFVNR